MRELILLSIVTKSILKEVIKVYRRRARQEMYAETSTPMREVLNSAPLYDELAKAVKNGKQHAQPRPAEMSPVGDLSRKSLPAGREVCWGGLRQLVNMGAKLSYAACSDIPVMQIQCVDIAAGTNYWKLEPAFAVILSSFCRTFLISAKKFCLAIIHGTINSML